MAAAAARARTIRRRSALITFGLMASRSPARPWLSLRLASSSDSPPIARKDMMQLERLRFQSRISAGQRHSTPAQTTCCRCNKRTDSFRAAVDVCGAEVVVADVAVADVAGGGKLADRIGASAERNLLLLAEGRWPMATGRRAMEMETRLLFAELGVGARPKGLLPIQQVARRRPWIRSRAK